MPLLVLLEHAAAVLLRCHQYQTLSEVLQVEQCLLTG